MKANGLLRGMGTVLLIMLLVTSFISCGKTESSIEASAGDAAGFTSQTQPAFVGNEDETYYLITFLSGYPLLGQLL